MRKLKEYRFSELYRMDSGISTTKAQAGHGAPFLSYKDIYNNPVLPEKLMEKMDTSAEEQERYSVKKGDIFLTRTSEVIDELAMSGVAVQDYPNATFSGFAKRLRPLQKDITYDKFMAFYLRSIFFRKIINAKAVMTLRASFNDKIFSDIILQLPDYDTQVKIGDLFYAIECRIRNNNKIAMELESMAKTIYSYWFLQYEFPDEEGKPYRSSGGRMVWNEELQKKVPVGWEVRGLEDFGTLSNGINYSKDEVGNKKYKIVNVRNMSNTSLLLERADMDDIYLNAKVAKNYLIQRNDILIARSGIPGAIRILEDDIEDIIYCGFIICLSLKSDQYRKYLAYKLKDYENTTATTSGGTIMQNVNQSTLRSIRFVIPTEKYILAFNEKIDSIWMAMKSRIAENRELVSLRDFLLPLLMNGQVGFKD
ncbi:MAG: restriction endonuclease subunit S [Blautia sp.]|nr:restriction endonuclease subunit S [Blautia sp.]